MKKTLVIMLVLATLVFCTSLYSKVKVGDEVAAQFKSAHPYRGGEGVVVEKVFSWPDAGYISLHFSQFDLAPGDYVEISDPDGKYLYTYREKGKKVRGGQDSLSEFWATHIPGDTAVVRLISKNPKGGFGFEIDKWVHGYERGVIDALLEDDLSRKAPGMNTPELSRAEALCSGDDKEWAQCYDGTTIYDKARAVSRLLIGGSSACTGWLIGSEGHLMTNNHCISSQTEANNTDYEFMAEGATCNTNCNSWFACPGIVEASSGTLVQTDSALDYSLILLPTNVTGTYGYLQLRNSLPSVGERIYIPQHPSAYGKMIAVDSDVDGGFAVVHSTNEAPCSGGPGDIGYYADTAGGSSGSPVLGYADHAVVALHHCANCPNRGVPIPSIISDLGSNLPNDALSGGTTPQPPAAPGNLKARGRKAQVNLTWSDNSGNEDGFYIYRGLSSGSLSLVATVGANTTSYSDTGLARRTTYYYKVCAYNSEGESCSSVVSAKAK